MSLNSDSEGASGLKEGKVKTDAPSTSALTPKTSLKGESFARKIETEKIVVNHKLPTTFSFDFYGVLFGLLIHHFSFNLKL
jgi:hypothetical protein